MNQISVNNFIVGILDICSHKPKYKVGHDGSTSFCDNIGLIRGGLLRSGVVGIKNFKDINQCARFVLQNVRIIEEPLVKGDIVLKTHNINDIHAPLLMKFRYGGTNFNGDENNYYDIGVVTKDAPLEIVHMTPRGMHKDKNTKDWNYVGWLPYVKEERQNNIMTNAVVVSNENFVRAYNSPSFSCKEYIDIPSGEIVHVKQKDSPWSIIEYNGREWCVFSKFLSEVVEEQKFTKNDIETLENIYIELGNLLKKINRNPKKRRWFK